MEYIESLYSVGKNDKGQLGLATNVNETILKKIPSSISPYKIVTSRGHSLLLDTDKHLWSCGNNVDGQLGLGHNNDESLFIKVDDKYWKDIAVDDRRSLAIDDNNDLYISGLQFDYSTNYSDNWDIFNDLPDIGPYDGYQSMCWSPELEIYCVISQRPRNGTIMTSKDGIYWTLSNIDNLKDNYGWTKVIWSSELRLFVLFSSSYYTTSQYSIATSTDGIDWVVNQDIKGAEFIDACWSPELGIFVATTGYFASAGGGDFITHIFTSSNGFDWTMYNVGLPNNSITRGIGSICWSKELNVFCGVSNYGYSFISSDGISWNYYQIPIAGKVCWSSELLLFCAVQDNSVSISSDGINWETIPNMTGYWEGIEWSPELKLFCIIGGSSTSSINAIAISKDGREWIKHDAPIAKPWQVICWSPKLLKFCSLYGNNNDRGLIETISIMSNMTQSPITINNIFTKYESNLKFEKISACNTHCLVISDFGNLFGFGNNSFGQLGIGNNQDIFDTFLKIGNDKWESIAVYNDTSAAIREDKIVFSSGHNNYGQLGIGSNIDTNVFTEVVFEDSNESINTFDAISINQNKIALLRTDGALFASGKNAGFEKIKEENIIETKTRTLGTPRSICYSPKLKIYCAVGTKTSYDPEAVNTTNAMWSYDGKEWRFINIIYPSDFEVEWSSICWSPELEIFCAVSLYFNSRITAISRDGINWEVSNAASNGGFSKVCWSSKNAMFLAIRSGSTSSINLIKSIDGINWVDIPNPVADGETITAWETICWSEELGIFVGTNDSDDSLHRVGISDNGENWTFYVAPTDTWLDIAWSPDLGVFVACKYSNYFMYSYDGKQWFGQNGAGGYDNRTDYEAIEWSSDYKIFIALPSGGGTQLSFSYDGLNWGLITLPYRVQYQSLCYGDAGFVGVSAMFSGNGYSSSINIYSNKYSEIGLDKDTKQVNYLNKINNTTALSVSAGATSCYYIGTDNYLYFSGSDIYNTDKSQTSFTKINNEVTGYNVYTNNDSVFVFNRSEKIDPIKPSGHALFSIGPNTHGELGLADLKERTIWTETKNIKSHYISGSIEGTFALAEDGTLYHSGIKMTGDVGHSFTFLQVNNNKYLDVSAASQGYHVFAIDQNNDIYSAGSNKHNQLGFPKDTSKNGPKYVTSFTELHRDNVGYAHRTIISKYGVTAVIGNRFNNEGYRKIYVSGTNSSYQLGTDDNINRYEFVRLSLGKDDTTEFSDISISLTSIMALDMDGNLYGVGDNQHGQFGGGLDRTVYKLLTKIGTKKWSFIYCGDTWTFLIDTDGYLFVTGSISQDRLGVMGINSLDTNNQFVKVSDSVRWFRVVTGDSHSMAIDQNYYLYATGSNSYGQMGFSDISYRTTEFVKVFESFADRFKDIRCGRNHTVGEKLMDDPDPYTKGIWVTGLNNKGQLGTDDITNRYGFVNVANNISGMYYNSIVCNDNSTYLIERGDYSSPLWSTGENNYGQLGLGDLTYRTIFTKATSSEKTIASNITKYGSVFMDNTGGSETYGAGSNFNGELGLGDPNDAEKVRELTKIGTDKWKKVSTSYYDNSSMSPTLAIRMDGKLFGLGRNIEGQLGAGETIQLDTFTQIDANNWKDISVSPKGTFSFGIMEDGTLCSTGLNTDGQLGQKDFESRKVFTPILSEKESSWIKGESIQFPGGIDSFYADTESVLLNKWVIFDPSNGKIYITENGKDYSLVFQNENDYMLLSIIWSQKLNKFYCYGFVNYETLRPIAIVSSNGMDWIEEVCSNIVVDCIWIDHLNMFYSTGHYAEENSPALLSSSDGLNWMIIPNNPFDSVPNGIGWVDSIVYAKERETILISGHNGIQNITYTTVDGTNWNHILFLDGQTIYHNCIWISDIQKFYWWTYNDINRNSYDIYTSSDGINWNLLNSIILPETFYNPNIVYSSTLTKFILHQGTTVYSSVNNGVSWVGAPDHEPFIYWSNIFEMFISFSYDGYVYTSQTADYNIIGDSMKFKKVSCGDNFALALSEENDLYVCGSNIFGAESSKIQGIIGLGEQINSNELIMIPHDKKWKDIAAGKLCSLAIDINNDLYISGARKYAGFTTPSGFLYINYFTKVNNKKWKNVFSNGFTGDSFLLYGEDPYIPPAKPDPDPTIPIEPPLIDEPYVMESDHENYIPIYIHDNNDAFLRRGVITNPITAEYFENLSFEKTLKLEVILDKKASSMIDSDSLLSCRGQIFRINSFEKQATDEDLFLVNVSAEHVSYSLAEQTYVKSTIPPPYWILGEKVTDISGNIGSGFEGKVVSVNSDNEPEIEIFTGGINYLSGEVITIRGQLSSAETKLVVSLTDQGRIISIRKPTIEEIDQVLPEYPWDKGRFKQQWTNGDGVNLEISISLVASSSSVPGYLETGTDEKPIKYYIYKRGDKFKVGDQVIVGDDSSLDPINYRRRLAKATVSKIKNSWIVNEDGSLTPNNAIDSGGEEEEETEDDTKVYAGPIETLSNFITGVSIPEIIEDPTYPDQDELIDQLNYNFKWSGTLTEICKEIIYRTNFFLVGTVPGYQGVVTFVSNGTNVKALLSEFLDWSHSTGYSNSDLIFDNYYLRFISIDYANYQFVYNSNKVKTLSYSVDKNDKDLFGNYKLDYSFAPLYFNYNTKITNNILILNDDLNINKILRISAFRFNPYDLFDCEITVSNLVKNRNIIASSIRTPEELKKEIKNEIISSINEQKEFSSLTNNDGLEGEDVGGVYDPNVDGTQFPTFDPSQAGYHLVVDQDGSVTAEPFNFNFTPEEAGNHLIVAPDGSVTTEKFYNIVAFDHIPTREEVIPISIDTVIFVYDPTDIVDFGTAT